MQTAKGIAVGVIVGTTVAGAASTVVAIASGNATTTWEYHRSFEVDGPFRPTPNLLVVAPVPSRVLAVGAVVGGLAAAFTKLIGVW